MKVKGSAFGKKFQGVLYGQKQDPHLMRISLIVVRPLERSHD